MRATALIALIFAASAAAAPHQDHDKTAISKREVQSSYYATGPNEDAVGKRDTQSSYYATGPNEDAVGKRGKGFQA